MWEKVNEMRQRERFKKSAGTALLKVMMSRTCFQNEMVVIYETKLAES